MLYIKVLLVIFRCLRRNYGGRFGEFNFEVINLIFDWLVNGIRKKNLII